jgi:hypothetical protein
LSALEPNNGDVINKVVDEPNAEHQQPPEQRPAPEFVFTAGKPKKEPDSGQGEKNSPRHRRVCPHAKAPETVQTRVEPVQVCLRNRL